MVLGMPELNGVPAAMAPLDERAMAQARQRWASRAKPPGSLGRLEDVAVTLAGIAGTCPAPAIDRPIVVVFAGDHGVVADGASAWPQEVTAFMVRTMADGQAAINAFAQVIGAEVLVVDVGVAADVADVAGVRHHKVRAGTASIAHGAAMTRGEAEAAVGVGVAIAGELVAAGADCLVGGDMGIGNTTPSAALIAAFCGSDPASVTGPGAGLPDDRIPHKQAIVTSALVRISASTNPTTGAVIHAVTDPIALLAEIGGLEIAALAGLYLGAAAAHVPFIVDGVIACAALCVAEAIAPGTAARGLAGHRSSEPAATIALTHLGLEPLLELDLRLGEGTGACLAVPLLQAAARAHRTMAELPGPS